MVFQRCLYNKQKITWPLGDPLKDKCRTSTRLFNILYFCSSLSIIIIKLYSFNLCTCSVLVGAFSQGAVNIPVPASFTSNCCNPRVLFVGLDLVGNMGTCSVSLVPDIVSLRAEPNNTFVSLNPGETAKVPFTLVNLGSKGSFLFHVTKTPQLYSYVAPFSLTLETNSSTAGHVIIKLRNETSEVWNLTVKAVSQSNNVNVKEVNLFDIQVSTQPRQPTTPSLKHVRLHAVAPVNRVSITLGERIEVNFTVTNLASPENFTFYVS